MIINWNDFEQIKIYDSEFSDTNIYKCFKLFNEFVDVFKEKTDLKLFQEIWELVEGRKGKEKW